MTKLSGFLSTAACAALLLASSAQAQQPYAPTTSPSALPQASGRPINQGGNLTAPAPTPDAPQRDLCAGLPEQERMKNPLCAERMGGSGQPIRLQDQYKPLESSAPPVEERKKDSRQRSNRN